MKLESIAITLDMMGGYDIGEFQILEVNCWIWTPISADTGAFTVPILAYVLIETHIKGVPIPSSEKYACIRIGHI